MIFGRQEKKDWNTRDIDWNAVDRQLISQRILVTRPEINGRKISSLRLRNLYGINISRVYRSGVQDVYKRQPYMGYDKWRRIQLHDRDLEILRNEFPDNPDDGLSIFS